MKVGDLIRRADTNEIAIIMSIEWSRDGKQRLRWLNCLWMNGEIEPIHHDFVEVISESR